LKIAGRADLERSPVLEAIFFGLLDDAVLPPHIHRITSSHSISFILSRNKPPLCNVLLLRAEGVLISISCERAKEDPQLYRLRPVKDAFTGLYYVEIIEADERELLDYDELGR
jgi:hypothetical protein